ncbi:MAG TPA: potassium channel family protein [Candidatus Dormibacteraeota bacterium]|jgi:voltage-gated potassium channel|nr:potassium channel family protein [Candidatus Dormibacteraeota bacterium]
MNQPAHRLSPGLAFLLHRGSVNAFVARHEVAWEVVMAAAALAYVVLTFLQEEVGLAVPDAYLIAFPALFVGEFVIRLVDSTDRLRYLRHHWIDGVTAIPLLGVLRALRILRLLRLIGLVRLGTAVEHAAARSNRDRGSLWFLAPVLLLLWAGAAYAFWILERGANHEMRTFGDALYMAFGAVTTFGYSTAKPVTPAGQMLSGMLIFVGIGLVTFVSSQVTSLLLHQRRPDADVTLELHRLEGEVGKLRELLERDLAARAAVERAEVA